MKKVLLIILLFLLMVIPVKALITDYNNYSQLEIETRVSSSIYPIEGSRILDLRVLKTNISYFPLSESKRVIVNEINFNSEPEAILTRKDNWAEFLWEKPKEKEFKYSIEALLTINNDFRKVNRKINFPDNNIPENYLIYIEPTKHIDINDEIKNKANEIVVGETDYYKVVHKLAVWVKENVEYDKNAITEENVQKSSWVFENRQGVCDEITNLYISFLRSLKIPARFIGGEVIGETGEFESHAWAEVYFPGQGWVPVDVTFGEIGWINPTHIKFRESLDSGESQVSYSWEARNLEDIRLNPLFTEIEVKKAVGKVDPQVSIMVEPLKKVVGGGSYVPIQVTIINPKNYYVPISLSFIKAPDIIGQNTKSVLLEPLEFKDIFWLVKVPSDIEKKVRYSTLLEIKTNFDESFTSELMYEDGLESLEKEWAEKQIEKLTPQFKKEFFPNLNLNCSFAKKYYYETDIANLKCNIENQGNVRFKNLEVCYYADCQNVDLGISEEKNVDWFVPLNNFKDEKVIVTAESKNMIKYTYTRIKIIKDPNVTIKEFMPEEVRYGEKSNFEVLLDLNGSAMDIKVEIKNFGHSSLEWLDTEKYLLIPFDSKDVFRENISVILTYHDIAKKQYTKNYNFRINVLNKPWYIRFLLWIESYFN